MRGDMDDPFMVRFCGACDVSPIAAD